MGSRPRHHLAGDGDGGELAALIELQSRKHFGEELHARERLLLVDPDGHLPRVDAVLEKLGRDAQALRIGRGVPEAAGVGEDARVDADRGVAAQRMPEPLDDLVGEDADARGLGIDVIDVAERLGGEVMVQIDQDSAARRLRDVRPQAIARSGIRRDGHVERLGRADLAANFPRSRQEAEVVGQLVRVVDDHFPPHLPQRRPQRQCASQRVAVRPPVHGEEHPPRRLQRRNRAGQVFPRAPFARIGHPAVSCLHAPAPDVDLRAYSFSPWRGSSEWCGERRSSAS